MKLTVLSFAESAFGGLTPAPNVGEVNRIIESLQGDTGPPVVNLDGAEVTVLDDHRGHMLYCTGGVSVYRNDPATSGGNGFVSLPAAGVEERVTIWANSKCYSARVRFS